MINESNILDEIISYYKKGEDYKHLVENHFFDLSVDERMNEICANDLEGVMSPSHIISVAKSLPIKDISEYTFPLDTLSKDKKYSFFKYYLSMDEYADTIITIHHKQHLVTTWSSVFEGYSKLQVFNNLEQFYSTYKDMGYILFKINLDNDGHHAYPAINFTNDELYILWKKLSKNLA